MNLVDLLNAVVPIRSGGTELGVIVTALSTVLVALFAFLSVLVARQGRRTSRIEQAITGGVRETGEPDETTVGRDSLLGQVKSLDRRLGTLDVRVTGIDDELRAQRRTFLTPPEIDQRIERYHERKRP